MAADTAAKRYSAINIASPWRGLNVVPNAAVPQGERQAVMFMYSGILAGGAVPPPAPPPTPDITPTPDPFTGGGGGGGGGPLDMGEESPPLPRILIDVVEPADRFKAQREKSTRIREQIRVALEGPAAPEVRAALEPRPVDSQKPLHERVDVDALDPKLIALVERHYQAEVRARAARLARELEEDDEDVMLLL